MKPAAQVVPSSAPVQVPEAPQKVRSVSGSTQVPPQERRPAWQDSSQVPAPLQMKPAAQVVPSSAPVQVPAAPQKVRSVSGSMQVPPQASRPAWHDSSQVPAPLQTEPAAQVVPGATAQLGPAPQ